MIKFKENQLNDIPIFKSYYSVYPSRQSDRSAGVNAMWRRFYCNRYAEIDGTIIFSTKINGDICFTYPVGKNPSKALDKIYDFCCEHGISMIIFNVNKDELSVLKDKYELINSEADRDWFDYLYDKKSLLLLSGKKYSTPRNHINKFKKLYSDWKFETITEKNISEIIEFTRNFTFNSLKSKEAIDEIDMCIDVLENYSEFDMFGGVLRANGKIIGYSVGEIISDTLFVHIEKADVSYAGAYQMLTNQFLRAFASDESIKFINREEDCGDEGLRKSKLSYHPVELIEKYKVTITKGSIL